MSVPPETIRVKRKRGDDTSPVSFLQLGDVPKRHRSGGSWAYQRVISGDLASRDIRPVVHPSKPSDGHYPSKHPLIQNDGGSSPPSEQEQRQFFMSRSPFVAGPESPVQANKKRRYSSAVFIERDAKKQGVSPGQGGPPSYTVSAEPVSIPQEAPPGVEAVQPLTGPEEMDIDSEAAANEPRALKRPGKSSRVKQPTDGKEGTPPVAAAPAPLPQLHGEMDKVAAEMNAWTVKEIQRNLDDLEQWQPPPVRPGSRDALKFQPRVPARRYAERHSQLQQGVAETNAPGGGSIALDTHQDNDADWVEVVYYRVPASKISDTIPRGDIGVIVFEDDEEKEYFYEAAEGDSDEVFEDEDDENAEDYYGADYPEDEVSSNDEYGFNPYKYNVGDEEFDDDEFNTFSDDDGVIAGEGDEETLRKIRTFVSRHSGR